MEEKEKFKMIKSLQEITGVGVSTCNKALIQTNFDMDRAVEYIETLTIAVKRVNKTNLNQRKI